MKMKRLFSILLCMTVVVILLPKAALAETASSVYVGSTEFEKGDSMSIYGGSVSYGTDGVLYLTNVTIPASERSDYHYAAIFAYGDLSIVLTGTNTATGPTNVSGSSYGVYVDEGSLTISGTGSLTATGGSATNGNSCGVYAENGITVLGGMLGGGGDRATGLPGGNSYGVWTSYGNITVSNDGILSGSGYNIAGDSYGVCTYRSIILSGGRLIGTGGNSTNNDSYGVYAYNDISITEAGGTLTGTGGVATSGNSYGVYTENETITVAAGTLKGTGGNAAIDSHGVHAKGSITLSSGALTGECGNATGGNSGGVHARGRITVSGGTLTGTSLAGKSSYGVRANGSGNNITVSGSGSLRGTSGSATDGNSCGVYCDYGQVEVSDNGTLTGTSGNAAFVTYEIDGNSYGVNADMGIAVSGGTLTGTSSSVTNSKYNYGVYSYRNITLTGGQINGTGGTGRDSYGVYSDGGGNTSVSDGTLTGTAGVATNGFSCGVYADNSITLTGGTLAGTGNSAAGIVSSSCGVRVGTGNFTVSGGTLTGTGGNAPQSTSYGLFTGVNSIAMTGGNTTAVGNTHAVNRQPNFGTAPANTWYKWKENTTTAEPADYTRSGAASQFSNYTGAKYLKIVPGSSAAVGNVTVSGTTGTPITDTDVTLTLTDDTFQALGLNENVSGWFNLPASLSAKIKTAVSANAATATVTIYGTPTATSTAAMAITIPATALTGGSAITAATNANAKYNIVAPAFVAVTDIAMTNAASVQVNTDLPLTGTATPTTATNRTVVWSLDNANGTGATVSSSGVFRAATAGTARVKAKVTNGAGAASDYEKTFDITVTAAPIPLPTITDPVRSKTVTATVGRTIMLSVQARNATGHQWYIDRGDGNGFTAITGATAASYTTSAVTMANSGYRYYCRVSNAGGGVDSPVFTLNVIEKPEIPATGDSAMPGVWIGIMMLAGAGLAASAARGRKKQPGSEGQS